MVSPQHDEGRKQSATHFSRSEASATVLRKSGNVGRHRSKGSVRSPILCGDAPFFAPSRLAPSRLAKRCGARGGGAQLRGGVQKSGKGCKTSRWWHPTLPDPRSPRARRDTRALTRPSPRRAALVQWRRAEFTAKERIEVTN